MAKKALITGITGQDGSYLAELLIAKGYEVHGLKRRSSSFNTDRINHLYQDIHEQDKHLVLHFADLSDATSIVRLIERVQPDEIYNLGAQSHVAVSFETPEYTADINALGTLRILEAIRLLKLEGKTRFYQASSSELYGMVQSNPQSEQTAFYPRSPYAVAKLYAHWITVNYREAYGLYACCGILFNHESPRRGETFVTRKITRGLANIAHGLDSCLYLGNLDSKRDWGHARDYVTAQWLMLQQDEPEDFVIATGNQLSVREFTQMAASKIGFELAFEGSGQNERGVVSKLTHYEGDKLRVGAEIIKIDPRYFRPSEVDSLIGDASKAHSQLGWRPQVSVEELCHEMVDADMAIAAKNVVLADHGYASDKHYQE